MTIYTPKTGEKKDDGKEVLVVPEVVTEADLLDKKDVEADLVLRPPMIAVAARRRRSTCANLFVLLTALFLLSAGIIGSIYLYKYLTHRTFRGWCGVPYYELLSDDEQGGKQQQQQRTYEGHFEEQVEIDKEYGKYEKIDVPAFEDVRRSSILHDFEKNYTAIVDMDDDRCYVMPLNRKLVRPPKDFWDLISKLRSGYYLPDAELVKENYRVQQPPVTNLSPFGYYIWRDCRGRDTYILQKIERQPIAMVKRSACPALNYRMSTGNPVQFTVFNC